MSNIYKLTTIKLVFYILMVLSISFLSCSLIKTGKQNSVRKIGIWYSVPVLELDGTLLNIRDSVSIYYFKNYILYELPIIHTIENDIEILSTIVKFKYFGHTSGQPYGVLYDSINAMDGHKTILDSLLKGRSISNFKLYDNVNDSLFRIYKNSGIIRREEYIPKVKYDQSYGDTTYFYYTDKLKNIDYSFSKELDSLKNLKVYKVKIVYNSQFYNGYSFKFPQRQFLFEMKEMPVENFSSILSLFKKIEVASQVN